MRALLVILGVVLGLLAAGVTGVRMSHLRHLVPDRLPGWSAPLDDAAGLLRGTTDPVDLAGAPLSLSWQIAGIGTRGFTWSLRADGPGRRLTGAATLTPERQLSLTDATGDIDLAGLDDLPAGVELGGTLTLDDLTARIDPRTRRILDASGTGRWTGARLNGQEIGAGRFDLTSGAGSWQIEFSLAGPLITASGTLRGRFNAAFAALEMTVSDAGAMPRDWTTTLSFVAAPLPGATPDAWRIERRISLPGLAGLAAAF